MKKINHEKQFSVFSFRFSVLSWQRLLKTENRKLKTVLRYRRWLTVLSALLLACAVFGAWRVQHEAQERLERERARLAREGLIPFELKPRAALRRPELQIWQDAQRVRAVARFRDSYFAATDGGLLELAPDGATLHHYTVLDGLPESDLTSLVAWQGRLFIGTRTQGLADFDGARFESYRFMERKPQAITALYADNGRLLIGTFAGGLVEFDGRQFKEVNASADAKSLPAINCLARDSARLYVGTFAAGLWLNEAGRWLHFTTGQGLPSNRIVGIVAAGERVFVATDFGLALAPVNSLLTAQPPQAQVFQTIATLPALASAQRFGQQILLGTDDGQLFALNTNDRRAPRLTMLAWRSAQEQTSSLTDCRLLVLDDELWLLTSDGIRRTHASAAVADSAATNALPANFKLVPFIQPNAQRALASNVVSALALDVAGRLWAGSFRDGLALLTTDGRGLTQIQTERAREINALVVEPNVNGLLAATSQGLVRFDAGLHATRMSTADGLLSNAITHVALLPAQLTQVSAQQTAQAGTAQHAQAVTLVCATSRGLNLNVQGRWRGLTTVQGLPSNSLYALLAHGRTLYVGTLGGLAQVEAERVVHVFTDANSKLTHNWVTALASAGERIFVGTYGGGVFELMPSGELQPFAHETGALVVNPNALWSDGARLYAGTLDGAWVFDLHAQRWTHLQAELPALTVLSITGDGHYVYFGTTNGIARIETSYFK
jgi:ligand-binding sensor domain-containing protein